MWAAAVSPPRSSGAASAPAVPRAECYPRVAGHTTVLADEGAAGDTGYAPRVGGEATAQDRGTRTWNRRKTRASRRMDASHRHGSKRHDVSIARRRAASRTRRPGDRLLVEILEPRLPFSVAPTPPGMIPAWLATPQATALPAVGSSPQRAAPAGSPLPIGFTPAEIRQAYGFDSISFDGVAADGSGTTIAIVTAYHNPNIEHDLAVFNATFGLPAPPSFRVVNQRGGSTMPAEDAAWSTETCIDVEWAHAIAPGASILLVVADSNSTADLLAATVHARSAPGVVAVGMSWGQHEFVGETSHDATFTTPPDHPGVTFFAASGDTGAPALYPAFSPNVVAVGGTSLVLGADGSRRETGWRGSGGGTSRFQPRPSYQQDLGTATTKRIVPDVAMVADPTTGLAVYDSRSSGAATGWRAYGGTSIAVPQWAALAAIVAQGRSLAGRASLDGRSHFLPALYGMPATAFHDVVGGGSHGRPRLSAARGHDPVTGLGTPAAARLVAELVAFEAAAPLPLPPARLAATATSPSDVLLTWQPSAGATGYRLFETTAGKLRLIATYDAATTSGTVTGLGPRSTHTWRLEAFNASGTATAFVRATTRAGIVAPRDVTVTPVSGSVVDIAWTPSTGARGYSIFVWSGETPRRVAVVRAATTGLRIGALPAGAAVRFAVRALAPRATARSDWTLVVLPSGDSG